ncbi:acyltransferase 3 [Ancylobacter novellus DSM 506]|uniref:Acyltransferase 3 n=2 Tax=Ancylobacter novellus TaxID=921 RepID=D6ZYT8_ANCN5|nr:acyltransferase 3 [Ancylobacter novellus DSM 506]
MIGREMLERRDDIQGLRALAVLAVIAFHLRLPYFPGGYVGVDVFFVISGFVITSSIAKDIASGSFSFGTFFLKRLRRLLPALTATAALTLVAAGLLFPPTLFVQTAQSALYSITGLSNIFFWREAGYFANASLTKPLLHTWSLSVEAQFYLVWPVLLVLAYRQRTRLHLVGLLGGLSIAGLIASEMVTRSDPEMAFFLTPFRFFEFAIGGLLALAPPTFRPRGLVAEVLLLAALAALAASIVLLSEATPFPGLTALLPCGATALAIFAGRAAVTGRILDNPAGRYIGEVSYSLYLVHWPIIVFWTYALFRPPTPVEVLAMGVATFAAGHMLFWTVEDRFRRSLWNRHTAGARLAIVVVLPSIIFGAGAVWAQGGWAWRSPNYFPSGFVDAQLAKRYRTLNALCSARGWAKCWEPVETSKKRVLVVGDSYAPDGLNIVDVSLHDAYFILDTVPGCPPYPDIAKIFPGRMANIDKCNAANQRRFNTDYLRYFDAIVISNSWSWYKPAHLEAFLKQVRSAAPDARIVILGAYYTLKQNCWELIERSGRGACSDPAFLEPPLALEKDAEAVASKYGATFLSKRELMCGPAECQFYVDDAKSIPFAWDRNHLSYEFARLIGERAKDKIRRSLLGSTDTTAMP